MRRLSALVLFVIAASCSAEPAVRPQWKVTLRTDAPVPLVGDQLRVEIRRADGKPCVSCDRLLDASSVGAWPISFGIAESPSALRIRVRLYRARAAVQGVPDPQGAIDAIATLPAVAGPVVVALHMACFGLAATDSETCDPATGALMPIAMATGGAGDPTVQPGSWREGLSVACEPSDAPAEMVCVPGGLFLFGDGSPGALREQLVRVSSFFVDRDELSVGRARKLLAAKPGLRAPRRHRAGTSEESVCKYLGEEDDTNDKQPLNCVSVDAAHALCEAQGKRLLKEAEFAYAAANGARGSRYPWGEDEDICAHAVVARGTPTLDNAAELDCIPRPGAAGWDFGPVPTPDPTRDETVGPAGLRNLGGNLSEWVQDTYAPLSDSCWQGRPMLVDPLCSTGTSATIRGGAWSFPPWAARARFRSGLAFSAAPNHVGFRCAKDVGPRTDAGPP